MRHLIEIYSFACVNKFKKGFLSGISRIRIKFERLGFEQKQSR